MRNRAQVQKHCHLAASFIGIAKRLADEGISQPMFAVRRVGDDILSKRFTAFEEIELIAIAS